MTKLLNLGWEIGRIYEDGSLELISPATEEQPTTEIIHIAREHFETLRDALNEELEKEEIEEDSPAKLFYITQKPGHIPHFGDFSFQNGNTIDEQWDDDDLDELNNVIGEG